MNDRRYFYELGSSNCFISKCKDNFSKKNAFTIARRSFFLTKASFYHSLKSVNCAINHLSEVRDGRTAHPLDPVRRQDISRSFGSNHVLKIIGSGRSENRLCGVIWQKFAANHVVQCLQFPIFQHRRPQYRESPAA